MTAASTTTVTRRPTGARRAYRLARHLPDRLLHRRRNRTLLRKLSESPRPKTILVVCHGNVCRSPYLQAVLQRDLPNVRVTSAGFLAGGRRVPDIARELSEKRGLDVSRFRSTSLNADVVREAELIVVMDENQASGLATRYADATARIVVAGDLDPIFEHTRAIRDPWNQASEVFEEAFNRLDRCAHSLVNALRPLR